MENSKRFQKIIAFMKKNLYLILLVASVLAITTIILVATLSTKAPVDGDLDLNVPPVTNPDNDNDDDKDPSDNNEPEKPIVFLKPVSSDSVGMDFTVDGLVYNQTLKQWQTHMGIDFLVEEGTNVVACFDGTVESITTSVLDGTRITIRHKDGLKTVYGSLQSEVDVSVGQVVKQGTVIGKAGVTALGECMDGAHVHFEVLENSAYVNPVEFFESDDK